MQPKKQHLGLLYTSKSIIPIALSMMFVCCHNRQIQVVDCEQFKKGQHRFPVETFNFLCANMYENKLYYADRASRRKNVVTYDFLTNKLDTIAQGNDIEDICIINDTTIFYADYTPNGMALNKPNGECDLLKEVQKSKDHPFWGYEYYLNPTTLHPLMLQNENEGVIFCFAKESSKAMYENLAKDCMPQYMHYKLIDSTKWDISFFGTYPEANNTENYYDGNFLNCFYNPQKNIFICHTATDANIVLCDSVGKPTKEIDFSSQKFNAPQPFPITDLHSMQASNNYYWSNTLYSIIGYDKYRKVYLRVLNLPRQPDADAMVKENIMDFVIIVADEDLNIKYEVFFDGEKYVQAYYKFLINEKGVLIFEKNNKSREHSFTASWFVFD